MTILQRIAREPVAIAGVLLGLYGVSVAFGWIEFTDQQFGAITTLGGAIVFAIRWLTTPSQEVVVQQSPSDPVPVAGPASPVPDGSPVTVLAA
jgi:hypothetical protein